MGKADHNNRWKLDSGIWARKGSSLSVYACKKGVGEEG
jgi:hypothetical protein